MLLEFLGAESMGVRSMATYVEFGGKKILIDPGVSLSPYRWGLRPHKLEIAASLMVRERIMERATRADIIVLTHYHFDHYTPFMRRIYEWSDEERAEELYRGKTILAKSRSANINFSQIRRSHFLFRREHLEVLEVDGKEIEGIKFSEAVPHGQRGAKQGFVIMALFEEANRFLFASDVQCVDESTTDMIIGMEPDIVYVSGPPLYHGGVREDVKAAGRKGMEKLIRSVRTLVIDHHIRRSENIVDDLQPFVKIADESGNHLTSASEFMGIPARYLEASRKVLHQKFPVGESWYEAFFSGSKEALGEVEELKLTLQTGRFS